MSTTRERELSSGPDLPPDADWEVCADSRLRFLARSLEPASWGGEPELPELDVEAALARVLARAQEATPSAPAREGAPLPGRRGFGWTRALAAALLLVGGLTPWLLGEGAPPRGPEAGLLAGVSTAAVVYAENSNGRGGLKG